MVKCNICNNEEYYGVLFCSNCGARLFEMAVTDTGKLYGGQTDRIQDAMTVRGIAPAVPSVGQIALRIGEDETLVTLPHKTEVIIGRADHQIGIIPDIDLTNFEGQKMGVSRQHIAIRRDEAGVQVVDLGSANGSLLNGAFLKPHTTHRINSGDELQVGKLIMNVLFDDDIE